MKRAVNLLLTTSLALHAGLFSGTGKKKPKPAEGSLLDQYIRTASVPDAQGLPEALPGAIWSPASRLNDLARDVRASQLNDVVTVLVSESTNAVSTGASATERAVSANSSITQLVGVKSPTGALANLLGMTGDQKLTGTGSTSRTTTLTDTLTARVVKVMPGGLLAIEGEKGIVVNSEHQTIKVRGVIRTPDISTLNTIMSTQVADLEIQVDGKGIVADAMRRPNILYRVLLGLLPF
ncbi:MAG: flagellar basal body L-ring protein FlgH [Bryobacteraceae bacterium]|jgi:flagellar L-ring protein precursor FlgH